MTVEIELKDLTVEVEFNYYPAEQEVSFYRNGDYGHEGSPEEIDIYSIKYKDREMIGLIKSEKAWECIEKKVWEALERLPKYGE